MESVLEKWQNARAKRRYELQAELDRLVAERDRYVLETKEELSDLGKFLACVRNVTKPPKDLVARCNAMFKNRDLAAMGIHAAAVIEGRQWAITAVLRELNEKIRNIGHESREIGRLLGRGNGSGELSPSGFLSPRECNVPGKGKGGKGKADGQKKKGQKGR